MLIKLNMNKKDWPLKKALTMEVVTRESYLPGLSFVKRNNIQSINLPQNDIFEILSPNLSGVILIVIAFYKPSLTEFIYKNRLMIHPFLINPLLLHRKDCLNEEEEEQKL